VPPHPALAAANGGPLAVKPAAAHEDTATADSYELLSPRFTAIVPLNEDEGQQLFAGQRAHVSYRPFGESIGQHLYHATSRWISDRFAQ